MSTRGSRIAEGFLSYGCGQKMICGGRATMTRDVTLNVKCPTGVLELVLNEAFHTLYLHMLHVSMVVFSWRKLWKMAMADCELPRQSQGGKVAAVTTSLDLQSRRQSRSCNASPANPPLADCFKIEARAQPNAKPFGQRSVCKRMVCHQPCACT
jgi:hypothetical protein